MACKPVPVKISQAEWRAMYEEECSVRYATAALGPDGVFRYTGEEVLEVDRTPLEVDPSLETARPSEVIRALCRKSYEEWAAMRWGNFRAAVAAIRDIPEVRPVIERTVDQLIELESEQPGPHPWWFDHRPTMHPPRKHHRQGVVVDVSHWERKEG